GRPAAPASPGGSSAPAPGSARPRGASPNRRWPLRRKAPPAASRARGIEMRPASLPPRLVHERLLLAAVDLDHAAVHEVRERRGEIGHEVGALLHLGDAPERNAARRELVGL